MVPRSLNPEINPLHIQNNELLETNSQVQGKGGHGEKHNAMLGSLLPPKNLNFSDILCLNHKTYFH